MRSDGIYLTFTLFHVTTPHAGDLLVAKTRIVIYEKLVDERISDGRLMVRMSKSNNRDGRNLRRLLLCYNLLLLQSFHFYS